MDYVLYFGRFSEEKGIGTLIKVCKELPDVQFVFAGTGPLKESIKGVSNLKNVGFQKGEVLEKHKKLCEQYSKNSEDISFDTIDEYYEKIVKVYQ